MIEPSQQACLDAPKGHPVAMAEHGLSRVAAGPKHALWLKKSPFKPNPTAQTGWALPVVLILITAAGLLVVPMFNHLGLAESLAQSNQDEQQTRWASLAMLRDAQSDLLGQGTASRPERHQAPSDTDAPPWIFLPNQSKDIAKLRVALGTQTCAAGVCAAAVPTTMGPQQWFLRVGQSARFGEYTAGQIPSPNLGNALLAQSAWYWLEVFPAAETASPDILWRITALAQGRWLGLVMQQAWWQPPSSAHPLGQWLSVTEVRE